MVKKSAFLALMLAGSLAGSASLASASDRSVTRLAPKSTTVFTVSPQLNGQIAALVFLGGQVFDRFHLIRGLVGVGKLPAPGSENQTQSAEGPDGCDPIGAKDGGTIRTDSPPPVPANNHVP